MSLPTLVLLLARLERLNESFVGTVCRRHDLSASELRVLAMLTHRVEGGLVSPSMLSEWIVQTSGGLTATLRRLEQAGHIVRVEDPDDGRGRLVKLTDQGAAFYQQVFADLTRRYESAFVDLDTEEALGAVRSLIGAFEADEGTRRTGDWEMERAREVSR